MIGETIEHYRILGELGVGGTGVVYRAEDIRLHREIALKLLRPHVLDDAEAIERFRREARITSALQHPHICTVHDVGQYEDRQFIVMERLEGTTLDRLIADGPLPIDRALRVAIDVCEALQAAHESGIVHRDVKPRNVFVTEHGEAKVMDFGLAKVVIGPSTPAEETRLARARDADLTEPGLAVGTIAYMAPEQARGEPVDGRADLFSLGAVIYEMTTGARAFPGEGAAVVFDALLNRSPAPLSEARPKAPPALQAILDRALEKERTRRYQSARQLLEDLRDLASVVPAAPARRRTWRVRKGSLTRRWIIAFAAAAVLTLAAAGWFWARANRSGPLAERDAVVLGRFDNRTGEAVFDDTVWYALAVNLEQSRYLEVLGNERVGDALRLMGRPPDDPLTTELARAVCQRQGAKAVLEGTISRAGDAYRLEVSAIGCGDGRTLVSESVSERRKESVLKAVAVLSSQLRKSLGESLGLLRSSKPPAEQATTASLEALKEYTSGVALRSRGQELAAIPYFERAVQLDPKFASAYYALSTIYGSAGDSVRGAEYARKAYAERAHVSEREQFSISYQYYDRVAGDVERQIATLTLWERSYPRDYSPSNNLSLLYSRLGQFERAAEHGREALRRNPNHPFPYSNLAYALRGLNQWRESKEIALQAVARGFETLPTRRLLYQMAVLEGDTKAAGEQLAATRGRWREFDMIGAQAQVAAFEGRRLDARALYVKTEDLARLSRFTEAADRYALQASWMELLLGDPDAAVSRATPPLRSQDHSVRLGAVTVLALSGSASDLDVDVTRIAHEHERDTLMQAVSVPAARAAMAIARGDTRTAVRLLESATPYESGRTADLAPMWIRATAHLGRGDGLAAAAEFGRILEHRGTDPFSIHYVGAQLGLARSLALARDSEGARNAYGALFVHWRRADPDMPALVAARHEAARIDAPTSTR